MAMPDLPTNPMNFTENQHGNAILDRLKTQKDQGRFCDVTLYVKDQQFRAHRSVLASCSPYFDSVFKTHRTVKERLTITCQNSDTFQSLLNYMYTGSIVIDKSNVSELLRLANHFLVLKLKSYCAEYLDRYLDATNCLSVREMAEKYSMPVLLKAATIYVQIHLNKIVHQEEILGFQLSKVEAFLSNKSWSVPTPLLLSLVTRWIARDVVRRERSMRPLLAYVDWGSLDGTTVSEHVDREPLYSNSETCLYVVLQALVDHSLLFPKYQGIYQALQDKFAQIGFPQASYGLHAGNEGHGDDLATDYNNKNKDGVDHDDHVAGHVRHYRQMYQRSSRRKKKLVLMRPRARLAALRAALAARRSRATSTNLGDQVLPAKCHVCSHEAADTAQLEQHLATVHLKDVTYKCGVCGFVCRWNKDYYAHMTAHFPGPPHKCDSCDFSCDVLSQVLTHRSTHTHDKPFRCAECGYRCRTRPNLNVHMRCHAAADRPFKCEMCERTFSSKPTLEQHQASHVNDRPFLCDICGFSTKFLSHLIAHKRIHTGDVYRCSYPQCKYSTPKKSQLGTHARTHVGVRPHNCATCGRGFLEKSHLVRHERIHLEEKPFKCSECEYASSRRDKLKEHFGRHHGQHASAKVPYKARPMRDKLGQKDPTMPLPDRSNQPLPSDLDLMTPHPHPHVAPPAPYPSFPEPQHHQLRPPPPVSKVAEHQNQLFTAANRSQHNHAAVAAMMLDPRFHHPNPNAGAYHPMVSVQGGYQNQQHQDYPCMPLF